MLTATPQTRLGKWSVGLNAVFLFIILLSVLMVWLGGLSFDDQWWNVTSFIAIVLTLVAFITGVVSRRKQNDRSLLVTLSILVSICAILFALLHSLFIND